MAGFSYFICVYINMRYLWEKSNRCFPGVEVRSPLSLARWPRINQLEMCLKAQSKLITVKVVLHLHVERVGWTVHEATVALNSLKLLSQ